MLEVGQLSQREEYLDELLKGVNGNSANQMKQTTEEGLLEDYDKELEGIDEDEFLREFEKGLDSELDFDMNTEFSENKSGGDTLEEELGLDSDSTSEDFMDNIDYIVNNVKNGTLDEGWNDGDLSIEESLKNFEEEDPAMDEIGQEFAMNDSFMVNTLEEENTEDDMPVQVEELSEAEQIAKEIEGLNLDLEEEQSGYNAEVEKALKEAGEPEEKDTEKGKKKGFLKRLSDALFGEEEEEVPNQPQIAGTEGIENISEGNLDALVEIEKQNASAAEAEEAKKQQEKEEKKALKEQKAKEKAEKKAEKKALKEQKAREKAEKKKLLKSQEPVEKTKPLPKKPVVLIMLFGLSIVVLINLLSSLSGYNTALAGAKNYYDQGKYVEAYGQLSEKSMKAADAEFYNKVRLTAYLQQQWKSYEVYQSQKMYDEALGALICGVGRYDRFIAEAKTTGVEREYKKMIKQIKKELKSEYKMSMEEARKIYALDDKQEFTYAVCDVINELGLNEEP